MTNKFLLDLAGPAFEHLAIISLPKHTSTKIIDFKYDFKKYGCEDAIHSKPHVTLFNFIQSGGSGDRVANHLERLLNSFSPMVVNMNGFGQFNSHTLFVNVDSRDPIAEIVKNIRSRFGRLLKGYDKLSPIYTLKPHITIAKQMSKEQHAAAWAEWKEKDFTDTFVADQIILLRRQVSIDEQRKCENFKIHRIFHLSGLGNQNTQLTMFN
ncbi:MAG: hypothetical protein K0S09_533 [Sphingobacteriaceae bacterium]|jgi:2'-5' RNA ligase|nr:hypothetical protein [Sphingobacteriaceae bacterium]